MSIIITLILVFSVISFSIGLSYGEERRTKNENSELSGKYKNKKAKKKNNFFRTLRKNKKPTIIDFERYKKNKKG